MICPWPPTPIFRFDCSGGPAAAPVGAAADVAAGALEVEPEQPATRRAPARSKNSLRILLTIDLSPAWDHGRNRLLMLNDPRRGPAPNGRWKLGRLRHGAPKATCR